MLSETEIANLDQVLATATLRRTGDPRVVPGGTLNRNYHVPTSLGSIFARSYRNEHTLERIQREHAITRWAADRGVPAVVPLRLSDGDTVVEVRGERWSLFPWIDGRVPVRGSATPAEVKSIGDAHGQIQHALSDHPESDGATLDSLSDQLAWDTATSWEALARVERAVAAADPRREVLDAIAVQRGLLENGQARPFSAFSGVPCQLLHGDFHDQQVLLGPDAAVVAVVDWEMTRVAPRVWELIRALSYSLILETDRLDDYLQGYARHVTLTEEECHGGVELWWQTRLHSTWVYEAYFLEGNERVAPFLPTTDQHLRRLADESRRTQIAERLIAGTARTH